MLLDEEKQFVHPDSITPGLHTCILCRTFLVLSTNRGGHCGMRNGRFNPYDKGNFCFPYISYTSQDDSCFPYILFVTPELYNKTEQFGMESMLGLGCLFGFF